jgi:hypothetical protein
MLRKVLLWAICKEYVPIDRKNFRTVIIMLGDFDFWCFLCLMQIDKKLNSVKNTSFIILFKKLYLIVLFHLYNTLSILNDLMTLTFCSQCFGLGHRACALAKICVLSFSLDLCWSVSDLTERRSAFQSLNRRGSTSKRSPSIFFKFKRWGSDSTRVNGL